MIAPSRPYELGLFPGRASFICIDERVIERFGWHTAAVLSAYLRMLDGKTLETMSAAVSLSEPRLARLTHGLDRKTIRASRRELVALGVLIAVGTIGQGIETAYRVDWQRLAVALGENSPSNLGRIPQALGENSPGTWGEFPKTYKEEERVESLESKRETQTERASETPSSSNGEPPETRPEEKPELSFQALLVAADLAGMTYTPAQLPRFRQWWASWSAEKQHAARDGILIWRDANQLPWTLKTWLLDETWTGKLRPPRKGPDTTYLDSIIAGTA